jgi:hypothetical protein
MPLTDYSPEEMSPRNLTKKEIYNPYLVIHELFDYAHLPELREELWDWLKLTVSGNYKRLSSREQSNFLYFYEHIEKLAEAVHIIHSRKKERSKPKGKLKKRPQPKKKLS